MPSSCRKTPRSSSHVNGGREGRPLAARYVTQHAVSSADRTVITSIAASNLSYSARRMGTSRWVPLMSRISGAERLFFPLAGYPAGSPCPEADGLQPTCSGPRACPLRYRYILRASKATPKRRSCGGIGDAVARTRKPRMAQHAGRCCRPCGKA